MSTIEQESVDLLHPALIALKCFFDKMNLWERGVMKTFRAREVTQKEHSRRVAEQREKVCVIFIDHVESGERCKRLMDPGLSYNPHEPVYDSEKENILRAVVSPKKVIVFTQQSHAQHLFFKYELVKHGDRWLIKDNRKGSFLGTDNWSADPL